MRAQLKVLGLSGVAFARKLGIGPSTISKILTNDYPGMKLDLAERIAWVLRTPLCELLKDTQPEHAHEHHDPPPGH